MLLFLDANELGLSHLGLSERVLTALLGYAVVFAGLLLLMGIIYAMGVLFRSLANRKAKVPAAKAALPARPGRKAEPEPEPEPELAPGSAGEVKRFDVPDKEAALIMAIVAEQMGRPLNELRFKSIKEVKEDEI